VGIVAAVILGWFLRGMIVGAEPFDPLTYGVVLIGAAVLAALASWIPARRALRAELMTVLRGE
jgi:ABC-type lipoprotein release transport system permease subunit